MINSYILNSMTDPYVLNSVTDSNVLRVIHVNYIIYLYLEFGFSYTPTQYAWEPYFYKQFTECFTNEVSLINDCNENIVEVKGYTLFLDVEIYKKNNNVYVSNLNFDKIFYGQNGMIHSHVSPLPGFALRYEDAFPPDCEFSKLVEERLVKANKNERFIYLSPKDFEHLISAVKKAEESTK